MLYELLRDRLNKRQKYLLLTSMYSWRWPRDFLFCLIKGIGWSPTWKLWGLPIIQKWRHSTIKIGTYFTACSDPRRNALGVFQKVTIKTLRPGASIILGNKVEISGAVVSSAEKIIIGNNVLIGSGALITDSDNHPPNPLDRVAGKSAIAKPVIIEDDVFIGARAIVLKGVKIGRGATIGAGSVVTKNVENNMVVAGNPARPVKTFATS